MGPTKAAITSFLDAAHGVPVEHRAAVLDHDGALRCERPTDLLFDLLPYVDAARREGWTVVSMLNDWSTVFPPA